MGWVWHQNQRNNFSTPVSLGYWVYTIWKMHWTNQSASGGKHSCKNWTSFHTKHQPISCITNVSANWVEVDKCLMLMLILMLMIMCCSLQVAGERCLFLPSLCWSLVLRFPGVSTRKRYSARKVRYGRCRHNHDNWKTMLFPDFLDAGTIMTNEKQWCFLIFLMQTQPSWQF